MFITLWIMETLIIKSEGESLKKIKIFLKSLQIPFETQKHSEQKKYDARFVKKILERAENAKNGDVVSYNEEYKKRFFE